MIDVKSIIYCVTNSNKLGLVELGRTKSLSYKKSLGIGIITNRIRWVFRW